MYQNNNILARSQDFYGWRERGEDGGRGPSGPSGGGGGVNISTTGIKKIIFEYAR